MVPLRFAVAASLALTCAPPLASSTPTPLPTVGTPTPSPSISPTPSPSPSPSQSVMPSPTATPTATPPATAPSSPTPVPATPAAPARAPYCAVADVLTPQRDYARPEATALDWTYALTRSYEPPDLVSALDGSPAGVSTFALPELGVTAADIQIVRGKPGYEAVLADDARALVRAIVH